METAHCRACHEAMEDGSCVSCAMNGQICSKCRMCNDCHDAVPVK